MAIQLIKNQELASKNKGLLNDNSLASLPLSLFASKSAPIPNPPHREGKRAAFTLAEVLITLGIIGVVAALTLPTLVQNYRKSTVETKLKKFYTTMNQALLMAKKDYGDFENWDYIIDNLDDEENPGLLANQSDKIKQSFDKYFRPYLNISDTKEISEEKNSLTGGGKNYMYYFSDGSAFYIDSYNSDNFTYYTENPEKCKKKKIQSGVCAFAFSFHPKVTKDHQQTSWKLHLNKGLEPHKLNWDGRDTNVLYTSSSRGCNTSGSNRSYCAAVIQLNGWRIPDDYPLKF